jgi:cytochrome c1
MFASVISRAGLALLVMGATTACARQATAGSSRAGQALIERKGCGACHTIPGVRGADGLVGPPLDNIGRRVFIAGYLRNTPANLATWVLDPQAIAPGNVMPATGLTPDEADDVAAYLETLR